MKTWNNTKHCHSVRNTYALLLKIANFIKHTCIILAIISFILFAVSGKMKSTYYNIVAYMHNILVEQGLELNHVYLSGQNHINMDDIIKMSVPYQNQSIFSINLHKMKKDIEGLAWVESCNITRHLPDTLHINIVERTPIAIWQYQQNLYLIDDRGYVFSTDNIEHFSHLIITVGEDAASYVRNLLTTLSLYPDIKNNISSAVRISDRRWNLITVDDTVIKLPENNVENALQTLHNMIVEDVISDNIQVIDLRDRNKVYTR